MKVNDVSLPWPEPNQDLVGPVKTVAADSLLSLLVDWQERDLT